MAQTMIYATDLNTFREKVQEHLDLGFHIMKDTTCVKNIHYPSFFSAAVWKEKEMFVCAHTRKLFVSEINKNLSEGWCFVPGSLSVQTMRDIEPESMTERFYLIVLYKDD